MKEADSRCENYLRHSLIIPEHVVNDLYVRFLSYLPDNILMDTNKILFHVQEAYWFYLDYLLPLERYTTSMEFCTFVMRFCHVLGWKKKDVKDYIRAFWVYCAEIPRCGGILMNAQKNKVLLVRNIGSKYWDFPVGKIIDQEDYVDCAEREVFEETGFQGQPSTDMICYKNRKAMYRLFIFYNVPEDYDFTPQTRNEIEDIKWFYIDELSTVLNNQVFSGDFYTFLSRKIMEEKSVSIVSLWSESNIYSLENYYPVLRYQIQNKIRDGRSWEINNV